MPTARRIDVSYVCLSAAVVDKTLLFLSRQRPRPIAVDRLIVFYICTTSDNSDKGTCGSVTVWASMTEYRGGTCPQNLEWGKLMQIVLKILL